jgi:hypothetical protein
MVRYLNILQKIMVEPYPWVLFENGTFIILVSPEEDLHQQAVQFLKGLYSHCGEEFGDVGIQTLKKSMGWILSSPHPDIFTLITPEEVPAEYHDDTLSLFSHGRRKRTLDAESCRVINISCKPGQPSLKTSMPVQDNDKPKSMSPMSTEMRNYLLSLPISTLRLVLAEAKKRKAARTADQNQT